MFYKIFKNIYVRDFFKKRKVKNEIKTKIPFFSQLCYGFNGLMVFYRHNHSTGKKGKCLD